MNPFRKNVAIAIDGGGIRGVVTQGLRPGQANKLMAWEWLDPVLGAFGQSTDTQQVHLTATLFPGLDFRRFQVDLSENIGMDRADKIPELIAYGDALWQKVLNDENEAAPDFRAVSPAP